MLVRLPGRELDRIVVGTTVHLQFDYEPGDEPSTDRPWQIRVGPPFNVVSARGDVEAVSFEPTPRSLAPVFELLHQRVRSAVVWLEGRLEVVFENEARLDLPPDPDFEAWAVSGHDGLLIVCTPGGGEPALWPGGEDQMTFTLSPES